MAIHIAMAQTADREAVVALLKQVQLLTDDLPAELSNFILAKENKTLVGVAGLEMFGSVGLLRSVAVNPTHQGKGIAALLMDQVLALASASQVQELYLITTTADHYFDRYGFAPVDRQQVPPAIQQTGQFSDLCPSSAIIMKRTLIQSPA